MTRVRKRTFIVMTLLGPLLMAAIFVVPVWISQSANKSIRKIHVLDKSNIPDSIFHDTESFQYRIDRNIEMQEIKDDFKSSDYDAFLYFSEEFPENPPVLYSFSQADIEMTKELEGIIGKYLETKNLKKLGVSAKQMEEAKVGVSFKTVKWTETGEEKESSAVLNTIIGFVLALTIYMFIFMYGAQVMRGVLEEKTGRIVEVLISSVKPFELMAGKILGIALLALTQFALWVILTGGIVSIAGAFMADEMINSAPSTEMVQGVDIPENTQNAFVSETLSALSDTNWNMLLGGFVFFFITGYLLYASLFAAIGSAVDNETDTQQFMLPVTVPLILSIIVAQSVISNPAGPVAFWFSIIPFTAPVLMPVRIAFDAVQPWEFLLSAGLMLITIVGVIWLAARIYRTGILKYGKKSSYADLFKWIKQK